MTHDEIASWALGHGFTDTGGGRYVAPYRDAAVAIEVGSVWVKVTLEGDGASQQLGRAARNRMHIEDDMLMGVGLGASFITRFMRSLDDRPPWIDERCAAATLGLDLPEEIPAPRP